jgi:hypothetical protein
MKEGNLENVTVTLIKNPVRKALLGEGDYVQVQGLVVQDWFFYSSHFEAELHYLDILTEGKIVRFWKPSDLDNKGKDFLDGFWEVADHGTQTETYKIVLNE